MKKLAIAATLSAGIFGLAACSADSDPEVVAKTEIGEITKEDFYEELKMFYGKATLENLIYTQVLENEYNVTDKEIDAEIQQLKDYYGSQFPMWLAQNQIEDEESENFRKQVKYTLLQDKVQFAGIEVTDEELEDKYQQLLEEQEIEIKASHILVEKKEEAEDIIKQLDEGADFAELAKEHGTDGTAEKGGDLGFFAKGRMDQDFTDASYALDVGEISEPVKTQHGYHVITVTEIKSLEDVEEEIRSAVKSEKVDVEEVNNRITKLLKDANIDIKIKEYEELFKFDDLDSDDANNNANSENNTDNDDDTNNDTNNEDNDGNNNAENKDKNSDKE